MAKRVKREKQEAPKASEDRAEEALAAIQRAVTEMIPPLTQKLNLYTESQVWKAACVGLHLRVMLSPDELTTIYGFAAYALLQEAKRQHEAKHGVQEVVE